MTGLAREDHGLEDGPNAERLYRTLSRLLLVSLLIGPILVGIWFGASAIENVKPMEPLPAPKIPPLPKILGESEPLPATEAGTAIVNLSAGEAPKPQIR